MLNRRKRANLSRRLQSLGMRACLTWTYLAVVCLAVVGCSGGAGGGAGGAGGTAPGPGEERGECRSAGTACNAGLVCLSNICVTPGPGEERGACRSTGSPCNAGLVCRSNLCVNPGAAGSGGGSAGVGGSPAGAAGSGGGQGGGPVTGGAGVGGVAATAGTGGRAGVGGATNAGSGGGTVTAGAGGVGGVASAGTGGGGAGIGGSSVAGMGGSGAPASVCGNGIVEVGESCDCGKDPKTLRLGCPGPNGVFFGDATGCSKTRRARCRDGATTRPATRVRQRQHRDRRGLRRRQPANGRRLRRLQGRGGLHLHGRDEARHGGLHERTGECLKLPVIFRDFKSESVSGGHPDFFYLGAPMTGGPSITGVRGSPARSAFNKRYCVPNSGGPAKKGDSTARCWDLAQATLDATGKPVFNAARTGGNLCDCQFIDWSHDGNGGHVPGGDTAMGAAPLNGLLYLRRPARRRRTRCTADRRPSEGRGQLRPVVHGQHVHGKTHTVATLELAPPAAEPVPVRQRPPRGLRRFLSARSAGTVPRREQHGRPGHGAHGRHREVALQHVALLVLPSFADSCRGDQYLFPPSVAPAMSRGHVGHRMQGWYHNFWFTTEARYLFNFTGAFSVQFFGDDDLFIFINGSWRRSRRRPPASARQGDVAPTAVPPSSRAVRSTTPATSTRARQRTR